MCVASMRVTYFSALPFWFLNSIRSPTWIAFVLVTVLPIIQSAVADIVMFEPSVAIVASVAVVPCGGAYAVGTNSSTVMIVTMSVDAAAVVPLICGPI